MSSPTIDFHQIREHAGSKHRGFEELVYQLIPSLDNIGGGEVHRHGTPDAGVEALVNLEDGTAWGWQAKYLFAFGSAELSQLDDSFTTALDAHPTLTRYAFVLPYDLPTARPRQGKSAKQRLEDAIERWKQAASSRGRSIEIVYVGESRLLDVLTRPEHAGRVRYWFDRLLFSSEWLSEKTAIALEAAGPRYTPELNVDLPIAFVLEGLGRTAEFDRVFGGRVRDIRDSQSYLSTNDLGTGLTKALRGSLDSANDRISAFLAGLDDISCTGFAPLEWDEIIAEITGLHAALERLTESIRKRTGSLRARELRAADGSEEHRGQRSPSDQLASFPQRAWRVEAALRELADLLRGEAARLVNEPRLLLTGAWGTGKTHLLCDVARRRNAAGRPTIIFLGQQIGAAPPWPQLLEQLGLAHLPAEEFLGALDAAAEAKGKRALVIVDAINEGRGPDVWPDHLRAFVARLSQFPRVGLVMSCRTNYLEAVLPREPGAVSPRDLAFVSVEHRGFVGEEPKATRTFFLHYGLTLPDFPLLLPEFSNPLFLKLLCRALANRGQTTLPRGGAGFTFLFGEFLDAANAALARSDRCDFRASDHLVQRAVSEIAQAMLDRDQEWLLVADAEQLTAKLLANRGWHASLLRGLIAEGVLAQNRLGADETVQFGYQRLSDHLRAGRILETHDHVQLSALLADLAGDEFDVYRHAGLFEALAVLLPERRQQELHDLVPHPEFDVIEDAFLASIIWRELSAFPEHLALDYLNSIRTGSYWFDDRVLTTLLHVACVPGHPFNAELLDANLARRSLPERDQWWTTYINHSDPESSVVYRIVDWARSEEEQSAADDAALLAATTLSWFLAASDRRLRDTATKALTNLLRRRIHLVSDLLAQFRDVDDPYISERLYAASYGCALATSDGNELAALAEVVFGEVFSDGRPPVHVLLRDYARGVVEVTHQRGVLPPHVDIALARPPYESSWPVRPPTRESLDRRASKEAYSTLRWSLLEGLKDFENYTVQYRVQHFEARNQAGRKRAIRAASRATAAEAASALQQSLTKGQIALAADGVVSDNASDAQAFIDSLSAEQRRLLHSATAAEPPLDKPLSFPSDEAARWILGRVLGLGWTPRRFREYDEYVHRRDYDRSRSRVERIGKKYQWIALHELLARLADNCRFRSWWNEESGTYDGPWQIGARDVDPSLLFEPVETSFKSSPRVWWSPIDLIIPQHADSDARNGWVARADDLPAIRALLEVESPETVRYLTLEGHYGWREEVPPQLASFNRQYGNMWVQIRSYFIARQHLDEFLAWARTKDWMGRWMPEGTEAHEVYLGEWPWHPAAETVESDWREAPRDDLVVPVLPTSASYSWSSEGDDSVSQSVNAHVPGRRLVEFFGLRWNPKHFEWVNERGDLIALDPRGTQEGPGAILVRSDAIRRILDDQDLALVWTVLGEKLVVGDHNRSSPRMTIDGVGALDSSGGVISLNVRTDLST
jgi:hypothetical protein